MTRRRNTEQPYTRLQLAQYRLRAIAMLLEHGRELPEHYKKFLIQALKEIGRGEEANAALRVNPARGERKKSENTAKANNIRFALSYVAALIAPESDGGFGMTLADAIAETATNIKNDAKFGYTEDTLTYYWNHHPEWQTRLFPRPIETLPDPRDLKLFELKS